MSIRHFFFLFGRPTANFGSLSRGQPHSPDVNHCVFLHFQPKGHREHRNEVGSLSLDERLVGFELGTFRFLLQRLNPLGHSPHMLPLFVQQSKFKWRKYEKSQDCFHSKSEIIYIERFTC